MNHNEALVALREPDKALLRLEAYRAAAVRANTIAPDFRIASTDDDDQATVDRKLIKDGIAALDAAVKDRAWLADPTLREMFTALEEAEQRVKAQRDTLKKMLAGRVALLDEAKKDWVRREQRRIAEEAEAARKANEAAAAAATAAESEESGDDMPPPPPAETFVPTEKAPTLSKVGTAKAVVKTSPVKCELAAGDVADRIREVAHYWPHLLDLNTVKAKAEYNALVARGQMEKPSEAGTVVGGIRFYVDLVVSG